MTSLLRARLLHDLKPVATGATGYEISQVLWNWLNDSDWVTAARRIPADRRRLLLAQFGRELYDRNLAGYAERIRAATDHLDYVWSANARQSMLRRHCEALLAELGDRVSFCDPAEAARCIGETTLAGVEHIRAAQERGRGIIFLGVHQSHPSFAFKHPVVAGLRIVGISHDIEAGDATTALLLGGIVDSVEILPASRGSVRDILQTLAAGNCLAVYNDYVYPESVGIASPLLGRTVLISRSAVAVALKTQATVLPVAISRQWPLESGGVRVEVFSPLPLEDLDRADPQALPEAALRFGVATECLIRLYPAQWRLWDTLECRWRVATPIRRPIIASS